jgi:hypothetical protein
LIDSRSEIHLSLFLYCFLASVNLRLHQSVSERKFLSMAPVTRRKGNRFPTQHDEDDREESGHEEQRTTNGDNEEIQAAMRAQIEDLTNQLAESRLHDRRRRRTPPRREEEEDEDDYGYGSAIPFAERRMQGRRPPAQAHANRWESGFKLDIPEFSGGMQPEEFLDWVAAVEEILDFKRVPEDRRVSLVATKFRGRAAAWWQQLKQTRARQGKLKITSWEKLMKKM